MESFHKFSLSLDQKMQSDQKMASHAFIEACLLYTSDAADDLLCVDLGGRRIIKKKNTLNTQLDVTICVDSV